MGFLIFHDNNFDKEVRESIFHPSDFFLWEMMKCIKKKKWENQQIGQYACGFSRSHPPLNPSYIVHPLRVWFGYLQQDFQEPRTTLGTQFRQDREMRGRERVGKSEKTDTF